MVGTFEQFESFWRLNRLKYIFNIFLHKVLIHIQSISRKKLLLFNLCPVHVTWTGHRMSKLVLNVKYFILFSFLTAAEFYNLGHTQKRSFLVLCTTFRTDFQDSWKNQNRHSTLNSSFDALSKWHDSHINFVNSVIKWILWEKLSCLGPPW